MRPGELTQALRTMARTFGWRAGRHRAAHELRRAMGTLRAHPSPVPATAALAALPGDWPFVPDASRVRASTDTARAMLRLRRVLAGEHHAYRARWSHRPRSAAEWTTADGSPWCEPRLPWFRVPHFAADGRDIKDTWEPGRFGWAYDVARGWMVTGDDAAARAFWEALEGFSAACPPFLGAQWACGQETAIRAIALLWAEGVLVAAPSSTPERLALLRTILVASADRIEGAIAYALSQRNNHGLSEAAALVAIGARFADAHPPAERWLGRGHRLLETQIRDQFAEDGWYAQHSFTYHRLALDQLVVAQRALRHRARSLDDAALARVRASVRLLAEVIDPATGDVPNHGPNDGAFVLPLSTAEYRDFRPALTAAAATFDVSLPDDLPVDEETLAWLGAEPVSRAARRLRPSIAVGSSGWANIVTDGARVFCRAGDYRTRPGHLDPLHVDVWIEGRPVAIDAGTYRYAAPAPWRNALAAIEVHNTVSIVDHPPARRGPRFLWLSWPSARIVDVAMLKDGDARIVMEHRSWSELGLLHRRTCIVGAHGVVVIDELELDAPRELTARVHWLLDGDPEDVVVASSLPAELAVARAEPHGIGGWCSDEYSIRRPATSLAAFVPLSPGTVRVVSGFGDQRSPAALERLARGEATRQLPGGEPCCT